MKISEKCIPIRVTGMPYSRDDVAVHFPVPFCKNNNCKISCWTNSIATTKPTSGCWRIGGKGCNQKPEYPVVTSFARQHFSKIQSTVDEIQELVNSLGWCYAGDINGWRAKLPQFSALLQRLEAFTIPPAKHQIRSAKYWCICFSTTVIWKKIFTCRNYY